MNEFLKKNKDYLTKYETYEIKYNYKIDDIYYLGIDKTKKTENYCKYKEYIFTDYNYNYILVKNDHISYRYSITKRLGSGSFGNAILCYDYKDEIDKVLKIIKNKKVYNSVINNEINILKYIQNVKQSEHIETQNIIINFYENIKFRNHNILIFEYYNLNLYKALYKGNCTGFTIDKCKSITYDLVLGLTFLHKHKIIHKDLKPENIVFSQDNSRVIIIDFGLSQFEYDNEKDNNFYIQSRYYRAPEVICFIDKSIPIDIWSLGCIMYEMYVGKPLFAGKNNTEMINYFISVMGMPSKKYIKYNKIYKYFSSYDYTVNKHTLINGKILEHKSRGFPNIVFLKNNDNLSTVDYYKDLCNACLTWEINDRILTNDLLNHDLFIIKNK